MSTFPKAPVASLLCAAVWVLSRAMASLQGAGQRRGQVSTRVCPEGNIRAGSGAGAEAGPGRGGGGEPRERGHHGFLQVTSGSQPLGPLGSEQGVFLEPSRRRRVPYVVPAVGLLLVRSAPAVPLSQPHARAARAARAAREQGTGFLGLLVSARPPNGFGQQNVSRQGARLSVSGYRWAWLSRFRRLSLSERHGGQP